MAAHPRDTSAGPLPLALFVLLLAAGGGLIIAQTGPGLSLGASLLVVLLFVSVLHNRGDIDRQQAANCSLQILRPWRFRGDIFTKINSDRGQFAGFLPKR